MRRTEFVVRYRTVLVVVGIMAALGLTLALVSAQPGPQEGQQQGQDQQRGGRDFGFMRMQGGMAPPAIAVAGDAIFVVANNMIYKFDAETLDLLAQAELPRPQRPQRPNGGGGAQ